MPGTRKLTGLHDPFPVICLRVTKQVCDSSDNLPSHKILKPNGAWLSGRRVTGIPHFAHSAAVCNHHRRTPNGTWSPWESFGSNLCTASYMATRFKKVLLGTPVMPASNAHSHLCVQPQLLDSAEGLRVSEPLSLSSALSPGCSLKAELFTQAGSKCMCSLGELTPLSVTRGIGTSGEVPRSPCLKRMILGGILDISQDNPAESSSNFDNVSLISTFTFPPSTSFLPHSCLANSPTSLTTAVLVSGSALWGTQTKPHMTFQANTADTKYIPPAA